MTLHLKDTKPRPIRQQFAERSRFQSASTPLAVALQAPAVRCLAVCVAVDEEPDESGQRESWVEIHPVLALVCRIESEWLRSRRDDPGMASTAQGMERLGWSYQGTHTAYEALVVDPDSRELVEARFLECRNQVVRVVAAPWPAAEDEERLEPLIRSMKAEALRAVERQAKAVAYA